MPHIIERARSGRAKCRKCKQKIEKDELRFGHEVESQFGEALQWYHLKCAAAKVPVDLAAALQQTDEEIPERAELEALIAANRRKQKPSRFPYAESAPTGRSSCIVCGETIAKGAFRIAIEREIDAGGFTRMGAGYLHPACTAKSDDVPDDLGEQIAANSTSLEPAELTEVQAALGG